MGEGELMAMIGDIFAKLDAVLGAVVGAGAVLFATRMTSRSTSKRDRERLSAEFLTIYLRDIQPHYAKSITGLAPGAPKPNHYNAQLVGNWFEIFAALILEELADVNLIERAGLKAEMRKFWKAAVAAKINGGPIDPCNDWPNLGEILN